MSLFKMIRSLINHNKWYNQLQLDIINGTLTFVLFIGQTILTNFKNNVPSPHVANRG